MSTNIIAILRHCGQLKGNLKFTALEIGHRMNRSGYVRMTHKMMAWKTGYSERTMYRHVAKLCGEEEDKRSKQTLRIFQKTVYRTANGYDWNLYKCLLPIPAFYRSAPATAHSDKLSVTLPDPKTGEAKELSLREEIARQKKGLRFLTNHDSPIYQRCLEEITRLEGLLMR